MKNRSAHFLTYSEDTTNTIPVELSVIWKRRHWYLMEKMQTFHDNVTLSVVSFPCTAHTFTSTDCSYYSSVSPHPWSCAKYSPPSVRPSLPPSLPPPTLVSPFVVPHLTSLYSPHPCWHFNCAFQLTNNLTQSTGNETKQNGQDD